MQVITCRVGGSVRPCENTRIAIHRCQGERSVLGGATPAGTTLTFDDAATLPMSDTAGISNVFFSLKGIPRFASGAQSYVLSLLRVCRFRIDAIKVGVWLPGDKVPMASDGDDVIHIGVIAPPDVRIGYEQSTWQRASAVVPSPAMHALVWH
jgi:hypothetical protein